MSRGVTTPVSRVYLLVSLTAPGPSGSPGPTRLCRGCSRPSRRPPGQAASSFPSPLRRQGDGRSLTSIRKHQRLVAHCRSCWVTFALASGISTSWQDAATPRSLASASAVPHSHVPFREMPGRLVRVVAPGQVRPWLPRLPAGLALRRPAPRPGSWRLAARQVIRRRRHPRVAAVTGDQPLQALHLAPQVLDCLCLPGDRLRLPGDQLIPGGASRAVRARQWQIGHRQPSSEPALSNQTDTLGRLSKDRTASAQTRYVTTPRRRTICRQGRECSPGLCPNPTRHARQGLMWSHGRARDARTGAGEAPAGIQGSSQCDCSFTARSGRVAVAGRASSRSPL